MRFQAVQYLDSDFPTDVLLGVLDSDTGDLYPVNSASTAHILSHDMNLGRKYSVHILPLCPVFMFTISEIQPL